MYIKMLDGRFAGQVRDIENGTALELLACGRAAKAFTETPKAPVAEVAASSSTAIAAPALHTHAARKGRAAR
jgi:hypothetical protein